MEPDFGGWATKANLKCSDGRTILPNAFQHMDKMQVPLVWQHGHSDPENILGYATLEHRDDGVYALGFFNSTKAGQHAKDLVEHKDIKALSIYANQLVEKGKQVVHGMIREVSLVLAGANPGAKIDWVKLRHGDDPEDVTTLEDEAVVHTGLEIELVTKTEDKKPDPIEHADNETLQEAYDRMPQEFKNVTIALVEEALFAAKKNSAEHSDKDDKGEKPDDKGENPDNNDDLTHKEGAEGMTRNVFDQDGTKDLKHTISPEHMQGIVADAVKNGSLKEAVNAYALKHGIESIETLFPDPKTLSNTPEWNKRRTEWVAGVLSGVRRSPFSRVKSIVADITQDEARAKGYIKGTYKKEEWFGVTKRSTTPTTVYKKQKLDRDDIIDITDFDVVAWMKGEMRMMLEEELARAILIGDGRDVGDEDKIRDPMAATDGAGIRSIVNEHELYATTLFVNLDDALPDPGAGYMEAVEAIIRARKFYKGTGTPTFYTTEATLTEMLLLKDELNSNRRLFRDVAELASYLRVTSVVPVEVMESEPDLVGIIVNLDDYNIGADKGGEVNLFDDFDIDYNQYKYLIETRVSGALVKIKSALIIKKTAAANVLVKPTDPTFVSSTGVVTIPTKTGVVYKNADTSATLTAGAQTALAAGATLNVLAVPDSGYYFANNAEDNWTFKRPEA